MTYLKMFIVAQRSRNFRVYGNLKHTKVFTKVFLQLYLEPDQCNPQLITFRNTILCSVHFQIEIFQPDFKIKILYEEL